MSPTEKAVAESLDTVYRLLAQLRRAADRATDDAVTAELMAIHDQVATAGERHYQGPWGIRQS